MEVIGTSEKHHSPFVWTMKNPSNSLDHRGSAVVWIYIKNGMCSFTCKLCNKHVIQLFWILLKVYGWIIPIVHIIVHQHHPMCAWSDCWNSWTSMNFSSLGMGIRIAMFAEIFFWGETIVVEKLRAKCSIFWRTFHRRRPRCWDVRRRM